MNLIKAKMNEAEEVQKQLILSKEQLVEDVDYWKNKCKEE